MTLIFLLLMMHCFCLAIYHIIPIMEGLMKGEVQVIAFDLPRDLLKRMSEANTWVDEQGFKKLQEVAGIGQKDTLTRARCAIQKLIEAKHKSVWLYSYKEDYAVLCNLR